MRIVGITLVRNEDFFIEWSVRNALPFCDELILADHQSSDRTPEILKRLAEEHPDKIRYHRISHPRESHPLIRDYAGKDCWVFGVDGDEIYDPARLCEFRRELEAGKYKDAWAIFGNVLNVKSLDFPHETATGHLAPPCRSMCKLYNFAAITEWGGDCLERLHGGTIAFHPGFDAMKRLDYYKVTAWENSLFRCLHLCFLMRSSLDRAGKPRQNIMDKYAWDRAKVFQKISQLLRGQLPIHWKEEKYARGESATRDIASFLPDDMSILKGLLPG